MVLLDIINPAGPVSAALAALHGLVHGDKRVLELLKHHFAVWPSFDPPAFTDYFYGMVLNIAAQIWTRVHVEYQAWPWRLFRIVDATVPESESRAIAQEFFDASGCDLDEDFSEWLRMGLKSPDDLLCPPIFNMLHRVAENCKALNMHLENLLAKIKASTPRSK
eukprot:786027-Lingulodinium_polyedra.AAC.1